MIAVVRVVHKTRLIVLQQIPAQNACVAEGLKGLRLAFERVCGSGAGETADHGEAVDQVERQRSISGLSRAVIGLVDTVGQEDEQLFGVGTSVGQALWNYSFYNISCIYSTIYKMNCCSYFI